MALTKRDRFYMDVALANAASSEKAAAAKVSAMIVIKNKPISFGTNMMKSHPFQAAYSKHEEAIFLHAETHAIKNALRMIDVDDLKKATIYIARVKKMDGNPKGPNVTGLAKPCKGCMSAIVEFNIKKIVFTTEVVGEYEVLLRS